MEAPLPESVKPSDFKVGVHYDECCESDVKHRVWLPFQDLPASPPKSEPESELVVTRWRCRPPSHAGATGSRNLVCDPPRRP